MQASLCHVGKSCISEIWRQWCKALGLMVISVMKFVTGQSPLALNLVAFFSFLVLYHSWLTLGLSQFL